MLGAIASSSGNTIFSLCRGSNLGANQGHLHQKCAFGISVSSRNPSCLLLVFLGDVLNFRLLQVSPLSFWDVILNGDILVLSAKTVLTVPTVPAGSCVQGSHTRLSTDAARDDVVTYPGSFCSANIWLHTHLEPQLLTSDDSKPERCAWQQREYFILETGGLPGLEQTAFALVSRILRLMLA